MTLTAYHIGYDEKTRSECPNGFTLLDYNNEFPRFKEIIPILMELKSRDWQPNEFVGFFSPRFFEKTGLEFNDIEKSYQKYKNSKDVILFSSFLPETYYWLNPWEQGEWVNPGVGKISNIVAKKLGISNNLADVPIPVNRFVFSHYLIAQRPFWEKWMELTNAYLELCEKSKVLAEFTTVYNGSNHSVHPFVVERFPSLLLSTQNFSSIQDEDYIQAHRSICGSYTNRPAEEIPYWWTFLSTRVNDPFLLLERMNLCKENFEQTDADQFKNEYWSYRIRCSMYGGDSFTEQAQRYLSNRTIIVNNEKIEVS